MDFGVNFTQMNFMFVGPFSSHRNAAEVPVEQNQMLNKV